MIKGWQYWRTFVLWVKRSSRFLYYLLMGQNPLQEELAWVRFNQLTVEMPQIMDAAVAEGLRNRKIARYLGASRN